MDKVEKPAALPDDPRDCCRAIMDELRKTDEWPVHDLPKDFAALVRAICEGEPDYIAEAMPGLRRLADQAHEAAKLYSGALDRTWDLARHGTGDHRESDRRASRKAGGV